jgi:hypothetical protein
VAPHVKKGLGEQYNHVFVWWHRAREHKAVAGLVGYLAQSGRRVDWVFSTEQWQGLIGYLAQSGDRVDWVFCVMGVFV